MDPRHYVASETLKDGTLVTIRAIRLDDADALLKTFNNLDRESVYRRFFELAFTTDSNYRGGGIATFILRHLVRIAREAGVSRFEADVLAETQPMLAVFRHSGLPMQLRRDGGVLHVTLSLQPDSRQQT